MKKEEKITNAIVYSLLYGMIVILMVEFIRLY